MVLGGQEALEVLVDEEEVEELGVAPLHQHEPRHRGEQVQREPGQPAHAAQQGPVAGHQQVGHADQARQHHADQALGQGRARQRQPHRQHPAELRAARGARPLRQRKAARAHGQEEAHAHIERDDLPEQQVQQRRRQDGRARGRRAPAAIGRQRPGRDSDAAQPEQQRPQARAPCLHAERLEGGGGGPVLQRRFFEVLQVVQARRDPVAGDDHLARDLGVAALVRAEQGGALEQVVRPQRGKHGDERDDEQRHPR